MVECKAGKSTVALAFEPSGKRSIGNVQETFLESAMRAGVRLAAVCGGRGLCRACSIQITGGAVPEPSKPDSTLFSKQELNDGWRRACQCLPVADCTVTIPAQSDATPLRTQINGTDLNIQPDPMIRVSRLKVADATLESPQADDRRLLNALDRKNPGITHRMDPIANHTLSSALRETDGSLKVAVRLGEVIGFLPQKTSPLLGLAVDLGTTNIGALLVDLRNGRTLATRGAENPQGIYGGDILNRMNHAMSSPEALQELQRLVINQINDIATKMCDELSLSADHLADIVVAGNTAMHHLFMGLPVNNLIMVPFAPSVSAAVDIKCRELGLKGLPGAYVHLLPNIAGYVGGDHVAALLAFYDAKDTRTEVLLDIGTNTEISLIRGGNIISLSCPSGPAFEGGNIKCGMRSAEGAIEAIEVDNGQLVLQTIHDAPATGICGSGVLDILAKLYLAGMVDQRGRLQESQSRINPKDGVREFVLASGGQKRDIVFTQLDIRAVQLAKSTIRTGIDVLLDHAGLTIADIDQIIVAGAFGSYINLDSAKAIGMFPNLPNEKFAQVGNAAGIGAKAALISYSHRMEAQLIADQARYIELSGSAGFDKKFLKNLGLADKQDAGT